MTILPLISFPETSGSNKSNASFGIDDVNKEAIWSIEIENLEAIAPNHAIRGIIDKPKKKANCPGRIDISGSFIVAMTRLINSFNFLFMAITFYFCYL